MCCKVLQIYEGLYVKWLQILADMKQNQNIETNLNSLSYGYEVTESLFSTILQARLKLVLKK